MNLKFLKITAPTLFHQRLEPGTLRSESQCFSIEPSWGLYVKGGDNIVNAKGRANEIGQSWGPYANTCSIAATTHTWVLFTIAH